MTNGIGKFFVYREVNKQISLLEDLTFTGVDFDYSLDDVVVNKSGQTMPPILKPLSDLKELVDDTTKEYEYNNF